jgi:hypothetical protein
VTTDVEHREEVLIVDGRQLTAQPTRLSLQHVGAPAYPPSPAMVGHPLRTSARGSLDGADHEPRKVETQARSARRQGWMRGSTRVALCPVVGDGARSVGLQRRVVRGGYRLDQSPSTSASARRAPARTRWTRSHIRAARDLEHPLCLRPSPGRRAGTEGADRPGEARPMPWDRATLLPIARLPVIRGPS